MEIQGLVQEKKAKFEKTLPCNQCAYVDICKYHGGIELIEIPEIFEVSYVCKKKRELDKTIKNIKI